MTDTTLPDERAERLARLRERRGRSGPEDVPAAPASPPAEPVVADRLARLQNREAPSPSGTRAGRRRSPAANAKIVTVGASATAMLGMIAGYGIADAFASVDPQPAAQPADTAAVLPVTTSAAEVPPASSTMTPTAATAPSQPQVIVVVVDGATGRTLSTTNGSGDLAADLASVGVVPVRDSTVAVAAPTPVAQPVAVELAVPAPPPPPRPAPQSAPPQAAPEAVSSGS